ncbi:hypothetical protein DY023_01815 [Microbacterium bovistercoris]|uniref:Uncharacterized protein n=1 Tax=Microbacterium bovistercoris TaxID=2293570 RepID=A0A371NYG2_9MICO|nr:hypothetical protein [Microbacterium bovistercoris]REJ08025.1 hypothetical protein DY023_01815 [Microbacterium bovistercoris]
MSESNQTDGISRRTVTKAMAWAVPAVAVASTIPMAAASEIITVSEAGDACKLPGGSCNNTTPGWIKGYLQPLMICNNSQTDVITVTITTPVTLIFDGGAHEFNAIPKNFTVQPDTCEKVILGFIGDDESSNESITGDVHWTWESEDGTQSGSGQTPIHTSETPPCKNCNA